MCVVTRNNPYKVTQMPSSRIGMDFYCLHETIVMPNKTTRGRSQDRSKIAGGQDYEVNYVKEKTGAGTKKVKQAIKDVGNSRKKVEKKLGK
jgi:hypothetical protein